MLPVNIPRNDSEALREIERDRNMRALEQQAEEQIRQQEEEYQARVQTDEQGAEYSEYNQLPDSIQAYSAAQAQGAQSTYDTAMEQITSMTEEELLNARVVTGAELFTESFTEAVRSIDRLNNLLIGEACTDIPPPPKPPPGDDGEDSNSVKDPPPPPAPDPVVPPFLVPKPALTTLVRGADREVTVINRHLFDDESWTLEVGNESTEMYASRARGILKTNIESKVDPFRFVSGKYWHFNKKEEKYTKLSLENGTIPGRAQVPFDIQIKSDNWESENSKAWITQWNLVFPDTYSESRADIYVRGNKSIYFESVPPNLRILYVEPMIPMPENPEENDYSQFFEDSVFSAEQPFYKKELDRMQVSQFTSVDIQPYVFGMDEQEVPEVNKVSLYRAFTDKMSQLDDLAEGETLPDRTEIPINCDYDDKVQKFTCESVLRMQEANESMLGGVGNYVEIEINTQQGSRISSLLHEFRMDKHILEALTSNNVKLIEYAEVTDERVFGFDYSPPVAPSAPPSSAGNLGRLSSGSRIGEGDEMQSAGEAVVATATATTFSGAPTLGLILNNNDMFTPAVTERTLSNALSYIHEVKNKTTQNYKQIDLKQYPIPYENYDRTELLRFTDLIRSQMFISKVRNYVEPDLIRSWSDILNGEKAYSEIIGYRIAKHEIIEGEVQQDPLQEFYLMDSDQIQTINFVDTQISTGKRYMYRIHSINFVVGSNYQYKLVGSTTSYADDFATDARYPAVKVIHKTVPSYKIIEAPFFERVISTEEKPPVFPQASFLTFQGVANKIQILLQSNFGERFQAPVEILPSDAETIQEMLEAQPIDPDGKIMFTNDSLPKEFQIFRLLSPPSKYSDFASADYIKTLPSNGRTLLFTENDIEPNKDYYYIFREIDTKGISNPTEVFRVKMVSYQNGIYMDLDTYEMQKPEDAKINMLFERSLQIMPSVNQRALNFPDDVDIDSREFALSAPEEVDVGTNKSNSIWGRNFKLRIKSKVSGKKIDINFKFTKQITSEHPDVTTEEPEQINPCQD